MTGKRPRSLPRTLLSASIIFVISVAIPLRAEADELRVVDSLGLVRAIKSGESYTEVLVTVRSNDGSPVNPGSTALLSNVDGISADLSVQLEAPASFRFHGVQRGTWKIVISDPGLLVEEVRIS